MKGKELVELYVQFCWFMPGINKMERYGNMAGSREKTLQQLFPPLLLGLADLCIAVARKISKIVFVIYFIVVDGSRFTGGGADLCQVFPVKKGIEERRLTDIRTAAQYSFRQPQLRNLTDYVYGFYKFGALKHTIKKRVTGVRLLF